MPVPPIILPLGVVLWLAAAFAGCALAACMPRAIRAVTIAIEDRVTPGFERRVFEYFERKIPINGHQRIDRIRALSPLGEFRYLEHRLDRMARRGIIERRESFSASDLPCYGMRSAKAAQHGVIS